MIKNHTAKLLFVSSLTVFLAACAAVEGTQKTFTDIFGAHLRESFTGKFYDHGEATKFKQKIDYLTPDAEIDEEQQQALLDPASAYTGTKIFAPKLLQYVETVGNSLLQHWDGTPINVKYAIAANPRYDAFATPDGTLVVSIGVIEKAADAHELAYVISHELSHLLLRHHERIDAVEAQKKHVQLMASAVVAVNVAKDVSVEKVGGSKTLQYTPSEQGAENIAKASASQYAISNLTDNVINTAWQRREEEEADLLGTDLLIKAGYTPRGMAQSLQHLHDQHLGDEEANVKGRVENLEKQAQENISNALQSLSPDQITGELQNTLKNGLKDAYGYVVGYLARTHAAPEVRREETIQYVTERYGPILKINRKNATNRSQNWQAQRELLKIDRISEAQKFISEAMLEIEKENYGKALKLARQSQSSLNKNHPAQRELMYHIRMGQGENDKAFANLLMIDNWDYASKDLYQKMIEMLLQKEDFAQALRYIEKSEKTFHTDRHFAYEKVVILSQLGREEDALKLAKKCADLPESKMMCGTIYAQLTGQPEPTQEETQEDEPGKLLDKLNFFGS